MDAVVTAGGIPQPEDPLYAYSRGESKALIDVAGKPMIQWVLDALSDAGSIDRVVVIGLTPKSGLTCRKPLYFMSNQGRMLANLQAGTDKVLEVNPQAKYVLFVSSDIPSITGPIVDWVVNTCMQTKDDLYYNVVRRQDMEVRFPGSKRTYTPLKDMQVCGGDMNVARAAIVHKDSEFWNKLIDARKNPAAQAALIGPGIILKFVFGQLTIDDVIQRIADKLGLKGRAIVCPYAEVGMDVDKPHQLELMRRDLDRRPQSTPALRKNVKGGARSTASLKRRPAKKKAAPKRKPAKKTAAKKATRPKAKTPKSRAKRK